MNHINIVPIFNQRAPLIWSTFVGIQSAAMRSAYKYKTSQQEMALNIAMLNTAWARQPCFAFAAYNVYNKMVGCIHGCIGQPYTTVNGLYVLPEYKKMGIGSMLLAASERAASVYANRVKLTALWNAKNFYQARQYNVLSVRDGLYEKHISTSGADKVVPIFVCSNDVAMLCDNIAQVYDLRFDASDVNKKHLPMFAYLHADMTIGGYILGASSGAEKDVRIAQLCVGDPNRHDIVRRLIESMAAMNIR